MCVCRQNDARNNWKMLGEPSFVQPFVGMWQFSGDYGIQVPDTWFYDIA